jgi:ribose transport system substrate-binding protein
MSLKPIGLAAAACCLAVTVAACGSNNNSNSSDSSASSSGGAGKDYNLSLVVGQKGPAFYTNMICGASAEAKKLGVSLNSAGAPDWGPAQQIPLINASLARKPDALIVVPTDGKGLNPVLQQAKNSGVKILTADTVLDPVTGLAAAAVTSASENGGKLAADEMGKDLNGTGTVLPISNPPGIPTSAARLKGFLGELKAKFPNIKILPTQYNDTTAQKSASLVAAGLSAHPEITGVFGTDDVGTIGAGTAVRNGHKTDSINVVGFDADPSMVASLKRGEIDALVAQRPDIEGQKAVQLAIAAIKGQKVAALTTTPHVVVTRDNIDTPQAQEAVYKNSCG